MKKIVAILIFLSSITLSSQNFSHIPGKSYQPAMKSKFQNYIGFDENSVYIKRRSTQGKGITHFIEKINTTTLNHVFSVDIEIPETQKIQGIYLKCNKLMVFLTRFEKKEKTKYLLLKEFSTQDGSKIEDTKVVATIPIEHIEEFHVCFSPDESKMVVISNHRKQGNTPNRMAFIYDTKTLKKLDEKPLTSTTPDDRIFTIDKFKIDNEGNLFYSFAAGIAISLINSPNTNIVLFDLAKLSPIVLARDYVYEFDNFDFEFDNENIYFTCVVVDDKLSDDSPVSETIFRNGLQTFVVDKKTHKIKQQSINYIKDNLKEKFIDKAKSKGYYAIDTALFVNDNYYTIGSRKYLCSNSGNNIWYDCKELIITKYNKEAKMEWMKVIPKGSSSHTALYNLMIKDKKLHFIYNESIENIQNLNINNRDPNLIKSASSGSALIDVTMEENGNLTQTKLFDNNDWWYWTYKTNIIINKNKGLLLRMINEGEERFDALYIGN